MAPVAGKYLPSFDIDSYYTKKLFDTPGGTGGSGLGHVTTTEVADALGWAEAEVDRRLGGVPIPSGAETPYTIQDIVRKLAGAQLLRYVLVSEVPHDSDFVKWMVSSAIKDLNDLQRGNTSLYLRDGTIHSIFRGPDVDGSRHPRNDLPEQQRVSHIQVNRNPEEMGRYTETEAPEDEVSTRYYPKAT